MNEPRYFSNGNRDDRPYNGSSNSKRDDRPYGGASNGQAQHEPAGPPAIGERLPPSNIEAEQRVIGAILIDNGQYAPILEFLRAEDFWRASHATIYRAIGALVDDHKPVSVVTLADLLARWEQFAQVGGDDGLALILDSTPSAVGALHHALIVKEHSVRRQVIAEAERITREAYQCRTTAQALAVGFERAGRDVIARNTIAAANPVLMFADIEERELEWLWHHRIPLGCLTTFAGVGGLGKSLVSLDLAARLTRGRAWPDSDRPNRPRDVLLISAEDPHDTVTKMRLRIAGADMDRIATLRADVFDRFNLGHIETLERCLDQLPECGMVIVDPPTALLPRDLDDHKNSPLRALLAPLASFSERRKVATILITHVSKSQSSRAADKVIGSVAWVNAVRSSWIFSKDDEDPQRRRFAPVKNNLAPFVGTLSYRISRDRPLVEWETGEEAIDADEVVSRESSVNKKTRGTPPAKPNKLTDWLAAELADGVPRPIHGLVEGARAAGLLKAATETSPRPSISPLYYARDRIAVLNPGFVVDEIEVEGNSPGQTFKAWQLVANAVKPPDCPD